ncbi:MAG: hypothetical protein ACI9X4_000313 [Glaciecola sp.]|jgi:hypothetical protein
MQAAMLSTKTHTISVPQVPKNGVWGLKSPWKTCGKPVGEALKAVELRGPFRGELGSFTRTSKSPLNNRGQLGNFRQVIHGFLGSFHSSFEAINVLYIKSYDKPIHGCPPETPPLIITNDLIHKGYVNNVAPHLNPTNP